MTNARHKPKRLAVVILVLCCGSVPVLAEPDKPVTVGPMLKLDEIIGIVNDRIITRGEIQPIVEEILLAAKEQGASPEQLRELRRQHWQRAFDQQVEKLLLLEAGERENIRPNEDLVQQVLAEQLQRFESEQDLLRNQLPPRLGPAEDATIADYTKIVREQQQIREVIGRKIGPPRFITPKELARHYKRYKDRYVLPERVKVRQFLVRFDPEKSKYPEYADAVEAATRHLEAVRRGTKTFAQINQAHSDGPYTEFGGLVQLTETSEGWIRAGQWHKQLEQAAFALEAGKVSDLIELEPIPGDPVREIYFIQLETKEAERQQTFKEVQDNIRMEIRAKEQAEKERKLRDELRKNAYILQVGGTIE